jgi:hypothetical protein
MKYRHTLTAQGHNAAPLAHVSINDAVWEKQQQQNSQCCKDER